VRVLAAAGVLACLVAAPRAGRAWGSAEHQQIGSTSYRQACTDVAARVAAQAAGDPAAGARLELVCGRNAAVLARLYGDATAIAGDFLGHPSEFFTHIGAWKWRNQKYYLLLALENSQHFNPMATRSWREYHERAVDHALAASRLQGVAITEAWELAVYENAFADHFLQDSFAAGHMGFNRPASSAAAAKRFHDYWNGEGRIVRSRAGDSWKTFGDGHFDDKLNEDSRRHVIATATLSIRDMMLTFVLGQPFPEEGLAVWQELPFAIQAPELLTDAAEVFTGEATEPEPAHELTPLLATVRPARKDTVLRARFWSAATFAHPSDVTVAGVAGFDLAVPFVPAQLHLGAGGTLLEPGGRHSLVIETGVLAPIGLSIDGLISHEVALTASWLFQESSVLVGHLEYQLNVELGTTLVTLYLGLSEFVPRGQAGWYGGLGFGMTFSAAGGGAF
jgi:hypothetical protein